MIVFLLIVIVALLGLILGTLCNIRGDTQFIWSLQKEILWTIRDENSKTAAATEQVDRLLRQWDTAGLKSEDI